MSATPATREPTTLADLATAIQSEHDAATTAARTAIGHAIRCGELLAEAKAQVAHGGWAGWLAQHFPASDRARRRAMRVGICESCAETFRPARADSRYCSNACRQRAYRKRATA